MKPRTRDNHEADKARTIEEYHLRERGLIVLRRRTKRDYAYIFMLDDKVVYVTALKTVPLLPGIEKEPNATASFSLKNHMNVELTTLHESTARKRPRHWLRAPLAEATVSSPSS